MLPVDALHPDGSIRPKPGVRTPQFVELLRRLLAGHGTTGGDVKARALVFLLLVNGGFTRIPFAHVTAKEWLLKLPSDLGDV